MWFLYTQSRFATVVFNGDLGPLHLVQHHTWQYLCISEVPEATYKAKLRALEGQRVNSKSPGSRRRLGNCWKERKRIRNILPKWRVYWLKQINEFLQKGKQKKLSYWPDLANATFSFWGARVRGAGVDGGSGAEGVWPQKKKLGRGDPRPLPIYAVRESRPISTHQVHFCLCSSTQSTGAPFSGTISPSHQLWSMTSSGNHRLPPIMVSPSIINP